METDEILKKAWQAVRESGVPEPLQEAAFNRAVDLLSGGDGEAPAGSGRGGKRSGRRRGTPAAGKRRKPRKASTERTPQDVPDQDTFFKRIAGESGVADKKLRDVLVLTKDGKVQVSPPTKDLGTSRAEQAKTVVALVAGARSYGLAEDPVNADAVRREAERKRCYDLNNFAAKSLAPMKGFNAGSDRTEIRLTSKWLDEFKAAVAKAGGTDTNGE
jgi:hypothetical protein